MDKCINIIECKVAEFLNNYELWDKTVLVGFSGGYDSMCLLHVLDCIRKSDKYPKLKKLVACHYNHNWRGKVAKSEQENCKNFCENLGIEFYTETAPDDIKKNETEARELRYAFFENCVTRYGNDSVVVTAHNFDDNAETVLYRIAKGTGIVGLKGILPKRDIYYRPLTDVKRADIETYCRENGLVPNNDNSNNDRVHKRNLIRHDIFPLLEEINPDVKSAINNLSKIAVLENEIIDEYISKIVQDLFIDNAISTKKYLQLSKPVRQKIIYNLIYNSPYDYSMELVNRVCEFIENTVVENKPSKYSIGKECWIYADNNIIEIIQSAKKNTDIIKVKQNNEYRLGDVVFRIKQADKYEKTGTESIVYADLSEYSDLYIRTRRDGDIIQPLGSKGKVKLKKYLMSKKIPQYKRDNLLLLTDGNEILWVGGVGMSEKIKVRDKSTHVLEVWQEGKK